MSSKQLKPGMNQRSSSTEQYGHQMDACNLAEVVRILPCMDGHLQTLQFSRCCSPAYLEMSLQTDFIRCMTGDGVALYGVPMHS